MKVKELAGNETYNIKATDRLVKLYWFATAPSTVKRDFCTDFKIDMWQPNELDIEKIISNLDEQMLSKLISKQKAEMQNRI